MTELAKVETAAEPKAPNHGLSTDELKKALAGNSDAELKEMARRLAKSQADLTETFDDVQAEQTLLQEENTSLRSTIELMMDEMKKLNIGANNTVDPVLDEGPLDFVNRMWEQVRPRDTCVVISEHVGEFRRDVKDGSPSANPPPLAQVSEHVVGKGKEAVQNLRTSLGPFASGLWGRAEQLVIGGAADVNDGSPSAIPPQLAQVSEHVVVKGREVVQNLSTSWGPVASDLWCRAEQLVNGGAAAAAAAPDAVPPKAPAEATAAPAPEGSSAVVAEQAQPNGDGAPAAEPPAEPAEAESSEQRAPGAEEQIQATILIEAQLTVDDGSVQTLRVRASDRCKEVSRRFVQEHSLKAWFEEPLTAWLKKAEDDAVTFPVKIEGDLLEIRKQHAAKR